MTSSSNLSPPGSSASSPLNSSDSSQNQSDNLAKGEKKKKGVSRPKKIFNSKKTFKNPEYDDENNESETEKKLEAKKEAFAELYPVIAKNFSERQSRSKRIEGLDLSNFDPSLGPLIEYQNIRIFVATWNVAGRSPTYDLNIDDFLHVEPPSDIYVIGFQEVVPLNAGNVLVIEDTEPAAKWLALINQALNKPPNDCVTESKQFPKNTKDHQKENVSKSASTSKDHQKKNVSKSTCTSKDHQKDNSKSTSNTKDQQKENSKSTCTSKDQQKENSKSYSKDHQKDNSKSTCTSKDHHKDKDNSKSSTSPTDQPTAQYNSSKITIKEYQKDYRSNFFHKPNLKLLSKNLRVDSSLLKACNCSLYSGSSDAWMARRMVEPSYELDQDDDCVVDSMDDDHVHSPRPSSSSVKMHYRLIASKKMVGLFVSVWARPHVVPHIAHLRVCSLGRGIMGRLGNKGCVSVSMTVHRTSLCFVCCHLASGEKEGDEQKRNSDVAEILKSTQFPKVCKTSNRPAPERIMDHDRIVWFGDLNYRVSLSYKEARELLKDQNWDALLEKDQLNTEKEAGRVLTGWQEGKIRFAPTYKFYYNSDLYVGDNTKSKKKRRTPAWCDRILWHGERVEQLSYSRGELTFSDHRPVRAVFLVEAEVVEARGNKGYRFRKGYSCDIASRVGYRSGYLTHRRPSFYEY